MVKFLVNDPILDSANILYMMLQKSSGGQYLHRYYI